MMRQERGKGNIAGLAALLLFGVFAVCVVLVLLTGADAYRGLTQRDQSAYSHRTAARYLTTRVRQADRNGRIAVGQFGGEDALLLQEEIDGISFVTRVYYYDGAIRELFSFADETFEPRDGEEILPAQGLELEQNGPWLTASIVSEDGTVQDLTLYLRSGEGVLP